MKNEIGEIRLCAFCLRKKRHRDQIYISCLTSITKVIIVQPFDFLRFRIQSSFNISYSLTSVIRSMFTMEGASVFLKASTMTAMGIFISSFSSFFFFQKGRDFILRHLSYFRNDPFCQENYRFKLTEKDFIQEERTRHLLKSKLFKISLLSSCGGIFSGFFTALITLPADNIRIRIQAMQNIKKLETRSYNYNRPRDSIIDTYRRFGFRGFYVATWMALMRESFAGFLYFGSFEYLKNRYLINQITYSNIQNMEKFSHIPAVYTFLYGSFSGALNWCLTLPIDHVKTKLISDDILSANNKKFTGTLDCITKTYNQFGLTGFYTGFRVILARAIIVNGAIITIFEKSKNYFECK